MNRSQERAAWTEAITGQKPKGSRKGIPQEPSKGEAEFALHCRVKGLAPETQYQFHETRKWKLDFAWPNLKLAVEIESSVHRIKNRFASDLDKYNALTMRGWRLLRHTRAMVHAGTAINETVAMIGSVEL